MEGEDNSIRGKPRRTTTRCVTPIAMLAVTGSKIVIDGPEEPWMLCIPNIMLVRLLALDFLQFACLRGEPSISSFLRGAFLSEKLLRHKVSPERLAAKSPV